MMSGLAQGIADGTWGYAYTYNHSRISLVPTFTPPASGEGDQYQKASLELTYVSSGRLRTVTLTATLNSSGDTATYDFTAEVEESGDDTYYLPSAVVGLAAGATHEEILDAFGGSVDDVVNAIKSKKKMFISSNSLSIYHQIMPVSAREMMNVSVYILFPFYSTDSEWKEKSISCVTTNPSMSYVKEIYPSGYSLKPSLYSLTSSSSSDDISAAVGGEAGLKAIIQAVKDGNRLVIRGTIDGIDAQADIPLKSILYQEAENGNLMIAFSYEVFGVTSYFTYYKTIQYTKSSNTFAVLNSGSKSFT